jgi:hypothetical protein
MDAAGKGSLYDEFVMRVSYVYMPDSRITTIHSGEEND